MIEEDLRKQESSHDHSAAGKATSWSRLKDPRIVRVSRAFGGKDRHSKVCTVKGLRDRRVRLSVPTAIQLYDLQDRLGLSQPSKVVDWLLHAAKNEIDELPPLQFPPGSFPIMDAKHGLRMNDGKCKDVLSEGGRNDDHQDWGNHHHHQGHSYVDESNQDSSYGYNSFARWDPSNLTLSHHHQPSRSHGLSPHQQHDEWPNFNLMAPLQPSVSHHHHQVLVYQHGMSSTQSYFPNSQIGGSNAEIEVKQLNYNNNNNNNQSSTASPVRQIHFNMMTANLLPSQNDDAS